MQEPRSKKDKRDLELANFLDTIHTSSIVDKEKQKLVEEFDDLMTTIMEADGDEIYSNYKKDKHRKNFYMMLCMFVVGVLVALIPSWIYMGYTQNNHTPVLEFVPNVMGYPKPAYTQIVKTSEQVKLIKNSTIRDANLASVGAGLKLGRTGLNLMPQEEMESPTYHLKYVGIQKDKVVHVNGFTFEPDTLWTRDPIPLHLLSTPSEIESARKMKNLDNKDLLSLGAAIVCPSEVCFVTAKTTLETEYSKVIPIVDLSGQ